MSSSTPPPPTKLLTLFAGDNEAGVSPVLGAKPLDTVEGKYTNYQRVHHSRSVNRMACTVKFLLNPSSLEVISSNFFELRRYQMKGKLIKLCDLK